MLVLSAFNLLKFIEGLIDFVHHELIPISNVHQNGQDEYHDAMICSHLLVGDAEVLVFVV